MGGGSAVSILPHPPKTETGDAEAATMSKSNVYYLPLTIGMLIGAMGIYTLPYVVGAAIDAMHLSTQEAGWLGAIEMAGIAVGSCALSPFVARLHPRRTAILGTLLAMAANLFSLLPVSFIVFAVIRALSGVACGVVLSIVTARVAASPEAEKVYGRVYTGMTAGFALLLFILPEVQAQFGSRYLFVALAVTLGAFVVGLRRLAPATSQEQGPAAEASTIPWKSVSLLFLGMTLAFCTYGGVYSFSERIGHNLGLSASAIGATLAASTLTAILGASLAGAIGTRWGRTLPLCGSILLGGFSYLLVLGAETQTTLVVGMVIYGLVSMFFNCYAFGTAAALDPSGRLASALQGYSMVPYGLGAGVLGTLASDIPFASLAWLAFVTNLVALAIVALVTLPLDRRMRHT